MPGCLRAEGEWIGCRLSCVSGSSVHMFVVRLVDVVRGQSKEVKSFWREALRSGDAGGVPGSAGSIIPLPEGLGMNRNAHIISRRPFTPEALSLSSAIRQGKTGNGGGRRSWLESRKICGARLEAAISCFGGTEETAAAYERFLTAGGVLREDEEPVEHYSSPEGSF